MHAAAGHDVHCAVIRCASASRYVYTCSTSMLSTCIFVGGGPIGVSMQQHREEQDWLNVRH